MTVGSIALAVVAISSSAAALGAQARKPLRPEVRMDATVGDVERLELGAGAAIPIGTYVRLALLAGAGVARGDARAGARANRGTAARADVVARFQVDPFHQSARGIYGGGGVSYLAGVGTRGRIYLTLGAGVELRDRGPVAPAVEVALGGGLRVSVALRRAVKGSR